MQGVVGSSPFIHTRKTVERRFFFLVSGSFSAKIEHKKSRARYKAFDFFRVSENNADVMNVIRGVTMKIDVGSTVAFVGLSGGGKSTHASLISRFFDVNDGSIRIGGADIRDIPKKELMSTVSFVFQNSKLIKASILENVKMGKPDATKEEVNAALKAAQCNDIIEKLPHGVDTVIGTKGVCLSGGERQRISIARAFLKDAPIILLDEATASLDVENETLIRTALSRLIKNKTVLVIAHRMRTVAGADKIVVLADGVVAEQGSPDELYAKGGIYAHMVDLQIGGRN